MATVGVKGLTWTEQLTVWLLVSSV